MMSMQKAPRAALLGLSFSLAAFAEPDLDNLRQQAQTLVNKSCIECHGLDPENADGDFRDLKKTLSDKESFINLEEPEKSKFYTQISGDKPRMPKGKTKLSLAERELILNWIKAEQAQKKQARAQRAFKRLIDIQTFVADRHAQLAPEQQTKYGYITLYNLHNDNRISDADLQLLRLGLFKALNSVSTARDIYLPEPLDAAQIIYRVELAKLNIHPSLWRDLVHKYPYRLDLGQDQTYDRGEAHGAVLRADWLVREITRAPVYHELLQLPKTEAEIAKSLGVDLALNISNERVVRAGFPGGRARKGGSRVSDHNRLIERHELPTRGALWISYDFDQSEGEKDLFNLPLGPTNVFRQEDPNNLFAFKQGGGEGIFNLPNGLQGYFIVDAKGQRIDSAPENVVRDTTNGKRAVVNGISCMSCHATGMQSRENMDLVRQFTRNNPKRFAGVQKVIDSIYVPDAELQAFFEQDQQRFLRALKEVGLSGKEGKEPIAELVSHFELDVDLEAAAAEIGVRVEDIQNIAVQNAEARELISRNDVGGGITRDRFIRIFASINRALGVKTVEALQSSRQAVVAELEVLEPVFRSKVVEEGTKNLFEVTQRQKGNLQLWQVRDDRNNVVQSFVADAGEQHALAVFETMTVREPREQRYANGKPLPLEYDTIDIALPPKTYELYFVKDDPESTKTRNEVTVLHRFDSWVPDTKYKEAFMLNTVTFRIDGVKRNFQYRSRKKMP